MGYDSAYVFPFHVGSWGERVKGKKWTCKFSNPISLIGSNIRPLSVQEGVLDDDNANDIKSRFIIPMRIANIAKWVIVVVGGVGTLVGAGSILYFAFLR